MSKTKSTQLEYPVLYKKTATEAMQYWKIRVVGTTIVTVYGQVNGQLQQTKDDIREGKNKGRANATTAAEQACAEALARWTKKKKSGYVEDIKDAKAGKVDSEVISGGIVPMLAKVYEDHLEKLRFPVAVQPKLDGIRCIATYDGHKVSLWTRTRKPILSVPHIVFVLEENADVIFRDTKVVDGELYNHDLKNEFEKIVSAVRKDKPSIESARIQYHIYDCVSLASFDTRIMYLGDVVDYGGDLVKLVDTVYAEDESEIKFHYDMFKKRGYEGAMVRQVGVGYENKRSAQLLKMKDFDDAEFRIVGVEEGRGRLTGHAGAFVCETKEGGQFRAKMSGSTERLEQIWFEQKKYLGKNLTVQYQGLSGTGIPRFPVGLRVREME